MLKAYYVEINPTKTQAKKIRQTIGVCRFVYNFYVAHNSENYKQGGKFISGMSFEKWMNNEYLPQNIDKRWIKDVSSKAVKQSIMNGQKAFNDFFKNGKGYPNFKKKNNEDVKAYFPKNNKTDWTIEDKRVKIPTLGFVRLKEHGYIPLNSNVKSVTVSVKAGRYYVSVLCDVDVSSTANQDNSFNDGIGTDFGIKDLIVASNGITIGNINKSKEMKRLSKKLKREQRKLSRRLEAKRNRKAKGYCANIAKQIKIIQRIHKRMANIRNNHLNQAVNILVKTKPKYIAIENLNISGIKKNKHLAKAISEQKLYTLRTKLEKKCIQHNIELRIVDRWYPSSKTCSCCGYLHRELKLSHRKFVCPNCDSKLDRDWNASINLRNTDQYTVA